MRFKSNRPLDGWPRTSRCVVSLGLLAWLGACGGPSSPPPTSHATPSPSGPRPNFVVIIADDMAADLVGSNRRFAFLELPNLERLAVQGVQFEHAFVTTSLCSPSRASMLSGLYAHSHGVMTNDNNDISPDIPTYPQLLQSAGYKTAFVGKWHMDPRTDAPRPGFDYWVGFRGQGIYENQLLNVNGQPVPTTGYLTDVLTDYAVEWLKRQDSGPFLLILSHKAPHGPSEPAARHLSALSDARLPEPPSYGDSYFAKPSWQRRYARCGGTPSALTQCPDPQPLELPLWAWNPRDEGRLNYLRSLLALDDSVGRVTAQVANQGLSANTYVVFVSDNGFFLGEHRLSDKRLAYEESLHVPLLFGGGGLAPRRVQAMALNLDLAPTLLSLAGAAVPSSMQGRSLVPLLRGETQALRASFLYEYFGERLIPVVPQMYAIRTAARKYVSYPGTEDEELYDFASDPSELTDLAARPDWAAERNDLRQQLNSLLDSTGAPR